MVFKELLLLDKKTIRKLFIVGTLFYGINNKLDLLSSKGKINNIYGNLFSNLFKYNTSNVQKIINKSSDIIYLISLTLMTWGIVSFFSNFINDSYNYIKNYNKKKMEVIKENMDNKDVNDNEDNDDNDNEDDDDNEDDENKDGDENKDDDNDDKDDKDDKENDKKPKEVYIEKRWYEVLWDGFIWIGDFIMTFIFLEYLSKSGLYLLMGDSNGRYPSFYKYIFELCNGIFAIGSTLVYEILGYKNFDTLFKKGQAPGVYLLDFIRFLASIPLDTVKHDSIREKMSVNNKKIDCDSDWIIYTFYLFVGGYYMYLSPLFNIITLLIVGSYFYNSSGMINLPLLKKINIKDVIYNTV